MKRLLLLLMLASPAFGHDYTLYHPNVPAPKIIELDPPQTNTFCASNLTCTVSAAWTFSSNLTVSGTGTFTGAITSCQTNSVLYVGTGVTCWAGADIGAQINSAYATLPASGGTIYVIPQSTGCYSYSTPIVFGTSDKHVLLAGLSPTTSGTPVNSKGSCLFYTPTTATSAITLDWTPSGGGGFVPGAGIRDITLDNLSGAGGTECGIIGGCGSSAIGINIGPTLGGTHRAMYQNLRVQGFSIGVNIPDNLGNSWGMSFYNDSFDFNGTAMSFSKGEEGTQIRETVIASNGVGIAAQGDIAITGGSIDSNNVVGVKPFSTSTTYVTTTGTHWENLNLTGSPVYSTNGTGALNLVINGGIAIDDRANNASTGAWFTAANLTIKGLQLSTSNATGLSNFLLSGTSSLNADIADLVPANIAPSFVCFPSVASECHVYGGGGTVLWTIGAKALTMSTPPGLLGLAQSWTANQNFPGNTVALTADWTCGTGGTVASCTAATIIGSGGGVPLTFTLPSVAQSYTLSCDGVVGQATGLTANQWNLLTATNGATNVTANYWMATAATASAYGAVTDTASTTTTFQITPSWTLGGTATKMPFHIWAKIEGASASGTVVSLQLLAPTVGDLVTIYRGTACTVF